MSKKGMPKKPTAMKEIKKPPPPDKSGPGKKFAQTGGDAVADDRNWISRIQNELNCTNLWQKDWGFLAAGAEKISVDMATKEYTVNDKIKQAEDELAKVKAKIKGNYGYSKSNDKYGKEINNPIEKPAKEFNIEKRLDLKPTERKLPKDWKKLKPEYAKDPFKEEEVWQKKLKNIKKKGGGAEDA